MPAWPSRPSGGRSLPSASDSAATAENPTGPSYAWDATKTNSAWLRLVCELERAHEAAERRRLQARTPARRGHAPRAGPAGSAGGTRRVRAGSRPPNRYRRESARSAPRATRARGRGAPASAARAPRETSAWFASTRRRASGKRFRSARSVASSPDHAPGTPSFALKQRMPRANARSACASARSPLPGKSAATACPSAATASGSAATPRSSERMRESSTQAGSPRCFDQRSSNAVSSAKRAAGLATAPVTARSAL